MITLCAETPPKLHVLPLAQVPGIEVAMWANLKASLKRLENPPFVPAHVPSGCYSLPLVANTQLQEKCQVVTLKVFNISSGDEMGGRWNGFDVIGELKNLGVSSKIGSFWNKTSNHPSSVNIFPGQGTRVLAETARALEVLSGRQATLQFWSKKVFQLDEFKEADLVHLQVVHDHLITVETIARIAQTKPTVWTWHDLWPLTGHCIFPVNCPRWDDGCGSCPSLHAPLEVVWDRTKKERKRKLDVFSNTPLNIHVTTNWMREKVAARTVGWNARIFQFPFGIDTSTFQPGGRNLARDFFGIEDDVFVVTARATDDERKGFVELVRALDDVVASGRRVLLLTLQQQGLVSKHSTNVESLELPWTNDLNHLAMFYQAADVFVMPSSAETFGMMALEAMACGTPVITVAGTATSEVVACNPLEVSPQLLTESLRKKLAWTIDNSEKLLVFGAESRKRALESFSLDSYLENLRTMYSKVLDGR